VAIASLAMAVMMIGAPSASATLDRVAVVRHDFRRPVQVAQPPGDARRLFVVGQRGRVRLIKDGHLLERSFLNIRDTVKTPTTIFDERGLLSIAFPPNYGDGTSGTTRNFYVFFVNHGNDIRVAEYRRDATSADHASASSKRIVLRMAHPSDRRRNHYGGQLAFGLDGKLYISTGDAGGDDPANRAQRLDVKWGKLLRIAPQASDTRSYTIPPDNPYYGEDPEDGAIWARGLRNPWRFSFGGQALLLPDVGEDRFEELNVFANPGEAKAVNLGWSGFEGPAEFISGRAKSIDNHRAPDFFYCHDDTSHPACTPGAGFTGCTIIGGQVSHDPQLPSLAGRYVYGDFCTGDLRSLSPSNPTGTDEPLGVEVSDFGLTSFGTDNAGRIYMTHRNGTVYRLVDQT
jgi:hypothetical protein